MKRTYIAAKFFLSSSFLNLISVGYNKTLFLPSSIIGARQYAHVTLHGNLCLVVFSWLSYHTRSWCPCVKVISSLLNTAVQPKGEPRIVRSILTDSKVAFRVRERRETTMHDLTRSTMAEFCLERFGLKELVLHPSAVTASLITSLEPGVIVCRVWSAEFPLVVFAFEIIGSARCLFSLFRSHIGG